MKLVLIRGAPAVGKTTVTRVLLETLKKEHHLDCAYISEDDFRKQLQFKYKAKDMVVHKNSTQLIETVILKLLSLDSYDYVFIEGQFRYKEVLAEYVKFAKQNRFQLTIFELRLNLEEMKKRDVNLRNSKSKDITEVKSDIDAYTPKDAIIIKTDKPVAQTVKTIIKNLALKP